MATQSSPSDDMLTLSNQVVNSIAEIDRLSAKNKAEVKKLIEEKGAMGFTDYFGRDMGKEALKSAYIAIDDVATRQRAEVIDLARKDLAAI